MAIWGKSAIRPEKELRREIIGVPVPGGIDDGSEIMAGGPPDRPLGQIVIGDQRRCVTFAAWPVFDVEVSADDVPNGLEQFFHRCSMPGSEVQGVARTLVQEMFNGSGMRVGKIENMDEIANT